MKIKNLKFKIPIMLLIFLVFFAGCSKQEEQKANNDPPVIPVKVIKAQRKDLVKTLEYAGNIKAKNEVLVYPKVTGKIVEKLKVEGDKVAKVEVIVYIDRDEVGLKFNKAPVESPLTGVIGKMYVDIGSQVSSQTPVAMVLDMDTVKINLDIPEKYIPKIYVGQEARITVDAYPDRDFSGKITQISPLVNQENRAAPIEITIENPEHLLKSGMFVRTTL
ncbi:MAG: efflux RND transporter periplasmic adaptor subunit, partial [Candidatus Omnitrophica bacterium]|nr:efflux RND transporter periplasmic adaptor subunit [Candidatus Omnitrophota bacterium]